MIARRAGTLSLPDRIAAGWRGLRQRTPERLNGDGATFRRDLARLSLPIALQGLLLPAVAATDVVMLGQLNRGTMAAAALACLVLLAQSLVLIAINGAGAILGAQYRGRGDMAAVGMVRNIMLKLSIAVSAAFFLGCICFPVKLMRLMTDAPECIAAGAVYLRFAAASCLLSGISQVYIALMQLSRRAGTGTLIGIAAAGVNRALDRALIFGLGFIPAMGIKGAAIATVLSRIVELALALALSRRLGLAPDDPDDFGAGCRRLTRDFARIAMPLLGSALVWGAGLAVYAVILGRMGADAAAAGAAAALVRGVLCCLGLGVASAGGILMGEALGAGDLARARTCGERLKWLSLGLGICCCVLTLLLIPVVPGLVGMTALSRAQLTAMLAILAPCMIACSINVTAIGGIFAPGGDTAFCLRTLAFCTWGVALPLSVLGVYAFNWPVPVIFGCACLDEVVKLPWSLMHLRKHAWACDLTRCQLIDAAPALPQAADDAATKA